jgi:pectate lyase-like protein
MKLLRALALFVSVSACAFGQATLMPMPVLQFSDASGTPLAGGMVYTCVTGSSCPGTPLAAYTDKTGLVPLPNPIVLNSAGEQTGQIWLGSGVYRIVVTDLNGVVQTTTDPVAGSQNLSASILSLFSASSGASLIGYTSPSATVTTVSAKLFDYLSAKADFGAKGDGTTDDTAKLQACINWSVAHRASCYLPPAQYRHTGLSILGSADLRSDAAEGQGQAQLVYYGTGSALTIGTGSALTYAVALENIAVIPGAGVTAANGINVLGLSESKWLGVEVSGTSTGGTFTNGVRFVDSGIISVDGLVMSNQGGSGGLGTTAVLFDVPGALGYGNSNIDLKHADIYFESKVIDLRSCDSCRMTDAVNIEAYDYFLNLDNSTFTPTTYNSFWVTNSSFTADQNSYFSNRKLLNVNAAASKPLYAYMIDFEGNRIQNSGGVTYPAVVTVGSGVTGYLNVRFAGNEVIGAETALVNVVSPSTFGRFTFGHNHINNAVNTIRTPDIVPWSTGVAQYFGNEDFPVNSAFYPLIYKDVAGAEFHAGSTGVGMTRPAAGADVAGAIYGMDSIYPPNSNGFLRTGASTAAGYGSFCDFSGYSTVSDMDRNIVCFVLGSEVLRMDTNGVRIGGSIYSYLQGVFKATASLTFSVPGSVPGCVDQPITITSAGVPDRATVAPPSFPSNYSLSVAMTAANTATVRWCQMTGAAAAPPSGSYTVTALR